MEKLLRVSLFTLCCAVFAGCVTPRKTHYLQKPDKQIPSYPEVYTPADYQIQKTDELDIKVRTLDEPSQKLFNNGRANVGNNASSQTARGLDTYTVYEDGTIDFPYLGSIAVEGKTTREIKYEIEARLKDYVPDCSVEVRLRNSYFNLLTESKAVRCQITKEKMTIFEALAVGGDLGPYSDRKRVKILRQLPDGNTNIREFDLRSKDVIGSEFYYIQPNDIIYVQPFKGQFFKVNSFLTAIGITSATISFGLLVWKIVDLCIKAAKPAQ